MPLSEGTINLAFRLILGRLPEKGRVEHIQERDVTLQQLRLTLLRSTEFSDVYEKVRRQLPQPATPPKARPHVAPWDETALVHMHIPKTAGSSLNGMLLPLYAPEERFTVGRPLEDEVRKMSHEQRAALKLLVGHCHYGIHRYLPRPVHYLCILREPEARLLSYYRYIRRTADHPMNDLVGQPDFTFGDFLMITDRYPMMRGDMDNSQVRRLAGDMLADHVDETIYTQAIENLTSPNLTFGLTERFGDFIETMIDMKIMESATELRVNVADKKTDLAEVRDELTPEQAQRLSECVFWDRRLYDHATALLDKAAS